MKVHVRTGARLHFGLLCSDQGTPWRFGGLGVMLRDPATRLTVAPSSSSVGDTIDVDGPPDECRRIHQRVTRILLRLRELQADVPARLQIRCTQFAPTHFGYGSGTQLTLALGAAVQMLTGTPRPSAAELAVRLERRERSAVGTEGFDRGGLLIDHGLSTLSSVEETAVERRVDRVLLPDEWRFVLIEPQTTPGLSGPAEASWFRKNRVMSAEMTEGCVRLISEQILPAAEQNNCDVFREALTEYGTRVGDFFAAQQGGVFSSVAGAEADRYLRREGLSGAVQSSWGPTVSVIMPSEEEAAELKAALCLQDFSSPVQIRIARPSGSGADVHIDHAA